MGCRPCARPALCTGLDRRRESPGKPGTQRFAFSTAREARSSFTRQSHACRAKSRRPPPNRPRRRTSPSPDELYITGLHLDQYRHATRCPTLYWREALRRDPLDARCNNALGLWHLKRGEFAEAETYFRRAIERLTRRNANPYDGEAYYNLGLCLRHLGRDDEAYAAFYKAVWNQAWMAAGYHALAEIDCAPSGLDHRPGPSESLASFQH